MTDTLELAAARLGAQLHVERTEHGVRIADTPAFRRLRDELNRVGGPDAQHALRLLGWQSGITVAARDVGPLVTALERAQHARVRAEQLRRGQVPGALSAREATQVMRRFG